MRLDKTEHGFTLLEMVVAVSIFSTGAVYLFSTLAGVTAASQTATIAVDLGAQNKKALTRMYNELQATSTILQDADGVDSTPPEAVFAVSIDTAAPRPISAARVVARIANAPGTTIGTLELGAGKTQARERVITAQTQLRFRKVVGFVFKPSTGAVIPEWSGWVTYLVGPRRRLLRRTATGRTSVVARFVDAFDVTVQPDGSLVITLVTARRSSDGRRLMRYANSVSVTPKN